jgi:hypothetical protein
MSSEPDSTFVVTTDDVQVIVGIAPMVLDDLEYLFADEIEPPQAYDPYPEVSAKCSLEDTAAILFGDDYDSYPYIEEGWDD